MKAAFALAAAVVACGRLGFDPFVAPRDAERDAPPDVPATIALVGVQAPGYQKAATFALTVAETAGDLLIAAVYWDEAPDTVTLTDTAGLAWSSLPAGVSGAAGCGGPTGNATGARLWYAPVTATGTNVVTATQSSGTQPLGMFALEYRGLDGANAADADSEETAPAASNDVFLPAITTHDDDVLVVFFNDTVNTGAMTPGTGFTIEAHDDQFPNVLEDAIVPAGTYTPTAALPTGQIDACWAGIALALRAH